MKVRQIPQADGHIVELLDQYGNVVLSVNGDDQQTANDNMYMMIKEALES